MPSPKTTAPPPGKAFPFTEARLAAARRSARPDDADAQGRLSWRDAACTGLTLRLNVTPSDSYTGVLYFRGSPGGTWDSKNISGGDNGKIIVKLSLGSWVSDDHDSVEYYFLVDGPGGSSGAGTRLSPYTMALK